MMVIKPDHERRIEIPGVPAPVRRPVDIDQAKTGFRTLRTLRIYRFDQDAVIEGHAEEDEVFLVVITGSVELTISEAESTTLPCPEMLSGPESGESIVCAAYLPPHAAYRLVAKTDADVAYARATPSAEGRGAKYFSSAARVVSPGVTMLLEEAAYAERLRLRIVQFDCQDQDSKFAPVPEASEGLVHIRTHPGDGIVAVDKNRPSPAWLESWDTLAVAPNDAVDLHSAKGSASLALIVTAI